MTINLSQETINTIHNALKCSEHSLKRNMQTASANRKEIIKSQLAEVQEALQVIEELL